MCRWRSANLHRNFVFPWRKAFIGINTIFTHTTVIFVLFLFNRITIDHSPTGPFTKLYIKSVQAHDEEIYSCVTTYLDPSDACNSSGSFKIKLNVLGKNENSCCAKNQSQCAVTLFNVCVVKLIFFIVYCLVIPSTIQMLDENGQVLRNDTTVGPLNEGRRFVSYCEARRGRPKPNVGWYLNGKRLTGNWVFALFSTFCIHCIHDIWLLQSWNLRQI